jgi:outer membrane protein assembly factor BamB
VADEERLYLNLGTNRLTVYELPRPYTTTEGATSAKKPVGGPNQPYTVLGVSGASRESVGPVSSSQQTGQAIVAGPQPQFLWEMQLAERLEQHPLLTAESVVLAGNSGTFLASSKYARQILYSFRAEATISSQIGQHGDFAYVPATDYRVYAMNMLTGKVVWRFTGGAPILRIPAVNDDDVYVTPVRGGLFRLNRATGQPLWQRENADRFLAANRKFVYASDPSGRLLVLDKERGIELGMLNTRDFVLPIGNVVTDRLLLASHDGLIVCLHDRAYPTPLRMKTEEAAAVAPSGRNEKPAAEKEGGQTPEPPAKEEEK